MDYKSAYDEIVKNIELYDVEKQSTMVTFDIFVYSLKIYQANLLSHTNRTQINIQIQNKTYIYETLFNISIICLNYISMIKTDATNNIKDTKHSVIQENRDLFLQKNHDYGNSFEDYGLIGILVRLNDKINRLISLQNAESKVNDEKIYDTINDLYNYAIIGLIYKTIH